MHSIDQLIDKSIKGYSPVVIAIHEAYLGPGEERFLCSFLVGSFALPGCKSRGLECTAIGEGHFPGAMEGHLIHGVQVEGGLLLTLTSREEADAWKDTRTSPLLVFHLWRKMVVKENLALWYSPGTEAGTVRLRAITVAMATCWGVYFVGQECPAVTMLGFSRVPSRYTWWSDKALYTAART